MSITEAVTGEGLASLPFSDLYIEPGDSAWFKYSPSDRSRNLFEPAMLKEISELREQLREHDKRTHFRIEFRGMRLRAVRLETVAGNLYVCRRLRDRPISFQKIGYSPLLQEALLSRSFNQGGLIIFTGGTGAGKSMSQASWMVERLTTLGETACTVENPIEIKLQGTYGSGDITGTCYQNEAESEEDYGPIIRNFLRAQPNIIMLGEVKTKSAAAEAVLAALSGHLVAATLHGNDAPSALGRFSNMIRAADMDDGMLADALAAVVHHSLSTRGKGATLEHTLRTHPLIVAGSEREIASRSTVRSGNFFQLKSEVERQSRLCEARASVGSL
jgi:twitching motility protein PilT